MSAPAFAVTSRVHDLFARVERHEGRYPSPVAHTQDGAVLGMRPLEVRRFVAWFNSVLDEGVSYRLPTPEEFATRHFSDIADTAKHRVWTDKVTCEALAAFDSLGPNQFQVSTYDFTTTLVDDLEVFDGLFDTDRRALRDERRLRAMVEAPFFDVDVQGVERNLDTVSSLYDRAQRWIRSLRLSGSKTIEFIAALICVVHPQPLTVPSDAQVTGHSERAWIDERWWELIPNTPRYEQNYSRPRSSYYRSKLPIDEDIRQFLAEANERISDLFAQKAPFDRESIRDIRVGLAVLSWIAETYNKDAWSWRPKSDVTLIKIHKFWEYIAELITIERRETLATPPNELLILVRE